MIRQHAEQVPSVARAHADDPDRAGRGAVERLADEVLNRVETHGERRPLRVSRVPLDPFAHAVSLPREPRIGPTMLPTLTGTEVTITEGFASGMESR